MSLGLGIAVKEDTGKIINNQNINLAEDTDKGPLFQIQFLEFEARGICVGEVNGGKIFCMSPVNECNTDSRICSQDSGEELL